MFAVNSTPMPFSTTLESTHIFLDSSVVIREGFLSSRKIEQLISHGRDGLVSLHMVDVSENEVLSHILDKVIDVHGKFDSAFRSIRSARVILKHSQQLSDKFEAIEEFSLSGIREEIAEGLRERINSSGISVHKVAHDVVDTVFESYFTKRKPFGEKRKKSEFPDAFILETIAKFCRESNTKVYILSKDGDILESSYDCIIPISDTNSLLGLIDRKKKGESEADSVIRDLFESDTEQVKNVIKSELAYPLTKLVVNAYSRDKAYTGTDIYLAEDIDIDIQKVHPGNVQEDKMEVYADIEATFTIPSKSHVDQPPYYELGNYAGTPHNTAPPEDCRPINLDQYKVQFWGEFLVNLEDQTVIMNPKRTEFFKLYRLQGADNFMYEINI